jgi:hypothetical protein
MKIAELVAGYIGYSLGQSALWTPVVWGAMCKRFRLRPISEQWGSFRWIWLALALLAASIDAAGFGASEYVVTTAIALPIAVSALVLYWKGRQDYPASGPSP